MWEICGGLQTLLFGKPFPFEGNWNSSLTSSAGSISSVRKAFPVWRELKHFTAILWSSPTPFGKPFPFEGNWNTPNMVVAGLYTFGSESLSRLKGIETKRGPQAQDLVIYWFGKPFPFEGNWNSPAAVLVEKRHKNRSESLSRLKGIETLRRPVLGRTLLLFGKPFPFEGNWNKKRAWFSTAKSLWVRKAFPVWRELKPTTGSTLSESDTMFGKPFPFEGNWNTCSSGR